jgi:hypothetical protein
VTKLNVRDTRQVSCLACETLEELLHLTSRPAIKLWASRWENDVWKSCSAGSLLGERVAWLIVAGGVALYSQQGVGSNKERREIISWANVSIHGTFIHYCLLSSARLLCSLK